MHSLKQETDKSRRWNAYRDLECNCIRSSL